MIVNVIIVIIFRKVEENEQFLNMYGILMSMSHLDSPLLSFGGGGAIGIPLFHKNIVNIAAIFLDNCHLKKEI